MDIGIGIIGMVAAVLRCGGGGAWDGFLVGTCLLSELNLSASRLSIELARPTPLARWTPVM